VPLLHAQSPAIGNWNSTIGTGTIKPCGIFLGFRAHVLEHDSALRATADPQLLAATGLLSQTPLSNPYATHAHFLTFTRIVNLASFFCSSEG
jgi:hypothetical protein